MTALVRNDALMMPPFPYQHWSHTSPSPSRTAPNEAGHHLESRRNGWKSSTTEQRSKLSRRFSNSSSLHVHPKQAKDLAIFSFFACTLLICLHGYIKKGKTCLSCAWRTDWQSFLRLRLCIHAFCVVAPVFASIRSSCDGCLELAA